MAESSSGYRRFQSLFAGPVLGDLVDLYGRSNHFNVIRVVAAFAVLVSHSWPLSLGAGTPQPLQSLLGTSLGHVAVAIFFVISGFLVTGSWLSRNDLRVFVRARTLRILPALVVVVGLTAFVFGPLMTTLSTREYFCHRETWTYLPRNVTLVKLQFPLPGVFESNPYGPAINGSLWTLFYEVVCYGAVAVAGLLGLFRSRVRFSALAMVVLAAGTTLRAFGSEWQDYTQRFVNLADLGTYFIFGMLAYLWKDRFRLSLPLGLSALVVAMQLRATVFFLPFFALALLILIFWIAYVPRGTALSYNNLGDYSYGLYILAFPMQQLAVFMIPGLSPPAMIAISTAMTLPLAVLSWHLIEKPALALNDFAFRGRATQRTQNSRFSEVDPNRWTADWGE